MDTNPNTDQLIIQGYYFKESSRKQLSGNPAKSIFDFDRRIWGVSLLNFTSPVVIITFKSANNNGGNGFTILFNIENPNGKTYNLLVSVSSN